MNPQIDVKLDDFRASYVQNLGLKSPAMSHFHAHNTLELFYLCNGERLYIINDKYYPIKKGDLVLIDSETIHRTAPTTVPDYERILIQIPKHYLQNINCIEFSPLKCFQYDSPVVILPKKEQTIIETMLYNIIDEASTQEEGYKASIQMYILQILIRSNRYTNHSSSARPERKNQFHKYISQVVMYINKHYMEPITIDMLADKFYISNSHLARTFKKVTGYSIIQYLNITRIRTAKMLLRQTNLSIMDISEKVGYNNVTHFGRIFKNATGYTPTEYRKISQT